MSSKFSPRAAHLLGLVVTAPFVSQTSATVAAPAKPQKSAVLSSAAKPSVKPSALPSLAGWTYRLDEDETEAKWTWTAQLALEKTASWETRIALDWKDERNFLFLRVWNAGGQPTMRFYRVTNGAVEKLGDPDATFTPYGANSLTLQRVEQRVRALWNGRVVATAWSSSAPTEARFGTASRGVTVNSARMQPVSEEIFLRDDFMRAQGPDDPEVPGQWHRVAGIWKTSGLLGPRADAALNPNPFVFRAEAPAGATSFSPVASVGKWFWSNYSISAAVRPALRDSKAPFVASLLAYRQLDGASVTGSVDFRTGRATLRVGDRVLATSEAFAPDADQWHRLFLDPGPGTMRLVVDGIERVRFNSEDLPPSQAQSLALAQGDAALGATLGGGNYIDFDDVRIGANDAISDNFRVASVGRWTDLVGEWQTRAATGSTPPRRVKVSPRAALTLTGIMSREEGLAEATFQSGAGSSAPFGVVFAARDAANYFLAKVQPKKLEIIEYQKGVAKVIGSAALSASSAKPVALSVEWRDGGIVARAGGALATASVSSLPVGRVGAWADGGAGSTSLLSFRVLGAAPAWGEGELPARFTKDNLMQNWAGNAAMWRPAASAGETRWHAGDFFDDAAVSLSLPPMISGNRLEIFLGASPAAPLSGSRLILERSGGDLRCTLYAGASDIKTVILPAATGALRVARRPISTTQAALRVALDGKLVINEITSATISSANTKVGIRAGTVALDWDKAIAHTSGMLDYTFTGAPVDWRAGKGRWEVS
ncbi:MAG TPA: hypothetical protein VF719_00175, partial [Abditibacteriaceae bacterium]